jgi:retinol dehydrogenase-14
MTHDDNGSMAGRVCVVTGATSGIGLETARALAGLGATLLGVGRSPEKAAAVAERLRTESGNPAVEFLVADLSLQAQVRRLAGELVERQPRLHVLVNNAGGFFMRRRLSADGIELTWALNFLSPFLLTNLLLEALQAGAPARIVNVSSDIHQRARLDWADLEMTRGYSGQGAYGRSKLALLLFTYELARRLDGTGVTVNAVHPGFVATNIGMDEGWWMKLAKPLIKVLAQSPEEGARTSIYLAASPEVEGVTGGYFAKKQPIASSAASYDEADAGRLWQIGAATSGLFARGIDARSGP